MPTARERLAWAHGDSGVFAFVFLLFFFLDKTYKLRIITYRIGFSRETWTLGCGFEKG